MVFLVLQPLFVCLFAYVKFTFADRRMCYHSSSYAIVLTTVVIFDKLVMIKAKIYVAQSSMRGNV